jgi:hypothetical protein
MIDTEYQTDSELRKKFNTRRTLNMGNIGQIQNIGLTENRRDMYIIWNRHRI